MKEEVEECDSVKPTLKNKAYEFLIIQGIHSLQEIGRDIRQLYQRYLLGEIHEKETRAWYLRGLDKLKLFDIRKKDQGVKVSRRSLKYEEKKIFLGYHPDYETAEAFSYCRNVEKSVWDFSIKTSGKLKYQVFTILNYVLENSSGRELTDGYLAPLNFFYKYSICKGISDLTVLEQD